MKKKVIFTIPILLLLSACNSLESSRIAEAEASYQKGSYSTARDICEEILAKDPYDKEAIDLLRRIKRKSGLNITNLNEKQPVTPYPVLFGKNPQDTVDDTWMLKQ